MAMRVLTQLVPTKYLYSWLAVLISVFSFNGWVAASLLQDDPFESTTPEVQGKTDEQGDTEDDTTSGPDVFDTDAAPTKPEFNPALDDTTQLIIRSLDQGNPTTASELARAIQTTIALGQFEWAKYYLRRLIELSAEPDQIHEMYQALGPEFFLVLHGQAELQPEARQFAKMALRTADRVAKSPEHIERLIAQLGDPDVTIRSETIRRLRRIGAPAAATMFNALADSSRKIEFPFLIAAIENLGESALWPILAAARANQPVVQAAAARALANIKAPLAVDALVGITLSPHASETGRRIANQSLQKQLGRIPELNLARQRLNDRTRTLLGSEALASHGTSGIVELWVWDSSQTSLVPRPMDKATAVSVVASQIAGDLYQSDTASFENRQLYLLTLLEMNKRIAGPHTAVMMSQLSKTIPDLNWEDIDRALGEAIDRELFPAAIAAAEIAKELGYGSFVYSQNDRPSNLVRALLQGQRHLQFAAADAIAAIDPNQAYVGSSYLIKTMIYFASTRGKSAGLVGDQRPALAQSFAASLGQNGMVGQATRSSRELFEIATSNPDLDVILVSDSLTRPDYVELVHQLRGDWRICRTPIGVLVRDENQKFRVGRLTSGIPNLIVLPMTLEPGIIYEQIIRLRELQRPWPIADTHRQRHAEVAMKWLSKVLADWPRYKFYDAAGYRDSLAGLARTPGNIQLRVELLASIGTPAGQRALLEFAGQANLSTEERTSAANALANSIQKHGALLTRDEILGQFDRFNVTAVEGGGVDQVLSLILESIESRAKVELK